jgi:hypothetical protein
VRRKERESNPQGAHALDRFRSGCRRRSAGPSVVASLAPVGGVEPPIVGLTGRRLTVGPHRNVTSQRGRIRTAVFDYRGLGLLPPSSVGGRALLPEPGGFPSFPTRCRKHSRTKEQAGRTSIHPSAFILLPFPQSAQRESNPHIRHGKATGCRYIMGANACERIVKEPKSTGWDSNPRPRLTKAISSPLDDQCVGRR